MVNKFVSVANTDMNFPVCVSHIPKIPNLFLKHFFFFEPNDKIQVIFSHLDVVFLFKLGPEKIKETSMRFSVSFRRAKQIATGHLKEGLFFISNHTHVLILSVPIDQTVFTPALPL